MEGLGHTTVFCVGLSGRDAFQHGRPARMQLAVRIGEFPQTAVVRVSQEEGPTVRASRDFSKMRSDERVDALASRVCYYGAVCARPAADQRLFCGAKHGA